MCLSHFYKLMSASLIPVVWFFSLFLVLIPGGLHISRAYACNVGSVRMAQITWCFLSLGDKLCTNAILQFTRIFLVSQFLTNEINLSNESEKEKMFLANRITLPRLIIDNQNSSSFFINRLVSTKMIQKIFTFDFSVFQIVVQMDIWISILKIINHHQIALIVRSSLTLSFYSSLISTLLTGCIDFILRLHKVDECKFLLISQYWRVHVNEPIREHLL